MTLQTRHTELQSAGRVAIDPDTAHFLDNLFDAQIGQLCLCYIDGDPSIPEGSPGYSPLQNEYYDWPRERDTVLRRSAWHSTQEHNIYVRMCLFGPGKGTTKKNALPSPWIWRDDVKDRRTAFSTLVETSEGNYQALIRLDRDASTDERKRLMTEWRNAHQDSDDCSNDPIHPIRVPGGLNTKKGGRWRVRYAEHTMRIYSADRLLERCKGETHSSRVSAARAEQYQADEWKALPDGWRYINSKRWQAAISGRPQLRTRLLDQRRVVITNKNGKADGSDSVQVAVVIQNLITARPKDRVEHFPEREIRAAMLALKPQLRPGVALVQYMVDVDCLINDYRPRDYTPRATRYLAPVIKRPVGRPTHAPEVRRFYLFLRERFTSDAPVSRKVLGDEFGVHVRTVATYLDDLRQDGLLSWTRKSRGLVITFGQSDVIDIISSPEAIQPIAEQQIEQSTPHHGETEYRRVECVSPDRATADHISPEAANSGESLVALPTLAELAKHYLDQPASAIGEQYVITTTGQISYRRTAKHFAQLVTAEYPYTIEQAIAAYKADQALREIIEAEAWRRFFARLKAMTNDELITYIAGGCRRDIAELARDGAAFDRRLYATRLKCAKQHLGWRGLKLPKRTTRIRATQRGDAWLPDEVPIVLRRLPLESLPDSLPGVLPMIAQSREAAHGG